MDRVPIGQAARKQRIECSLQSRGVWCEVKPTADQIGRGLVGAESSQSIDLTQGMQIGQSDASQA